MTNDTGYPPTPGLEAAAKRVMATYDHAERKPARVMVHTLTIDHKHGTYTRVFRTEEGARDALAAWVREWWPTEVARWRGHAIEAGDTVPTQAEFDALPDGEAIVEYFAHMDGMESYSLDSVVLED